MEIRNLLTFIHVAELNSFTKAAKVLDYSQSTVSFQIKQLETELGALLFERINHTLTLTDQGRELLEYAHKMCHLMDEFDQGRDSKHEIRDRIHIATSDSIAEDMIYGHYMHFHQLYPGISIKFTPADTEHMFEMLDQNEVDIVFTLDRHVYNRDYVIVKEIERETHFVVGSRSPLAARKQIPILELAEHPFYLTEKGMGYRKVMDEALAKKSIEIDPILEISRTDIITALLEQNDAVSFLPDFVTEEKVREGSIVRLDVPDFHIEIWKQMIHHKNKWISKALSCFINYVCEHEFS